MKECSEDIVRRNHRALNEEKDKLRMVHQFSRDPEERAKAFARICAINALLSGYHDLWD